MFSLQDMFQKKMTQSLNNVWKCLRTKNKTTVYKDERTKKELGTRKRASKTEVQRTARAAYKDFQNMYPKVCTRDLEE